MRRTTVIMAAASLAIAGMTIPASRWASAADDRNNNNTNQTNTNTGIGQQGQSQQQQSDQQTTGQAGSRTPAFQPGHDPNRPRNAAGQAGIAANDEQAVRDSLARVVDDATTPGKFSDLLNQLSRADADRMNGRTGTIGAGSSRLDTGTSGIGTSGDSGTGTSSGTASGIGTSGTASGSGNTPAVGTSGTSSGTASGTTGAGTSGTPAVGTSGTSGASGAGTGTGAAGARTGVGSDRTTAAAMDTTDLDARINQFQRDWKAKYNQEFSLRSNEKQVLSENFARINSSDYSDAARTAGERFAPGATGTGTGTTGAGTSTGTGTSSGTGTGTGTNSSGINGNTTGTPSNAGAANSSSSSAGTTGANRTGAAAADRGDTTTNQRSAVALVSGAPNTTPVTLRFINEGGQWKLDLPDSLDRQQLKANLIKHIDIVDRQKDSWPADPNEAYRVVTQHVLMAFNEDITQRGSGLLDRGGANRSGLDTGTGTGTPSGNPNANPNTGFGTGTGTSSGNNSTNGNKTNSNR